MKIDEVQIELRRTGDTATLLAQGRPFGLSIKITLRELEQLISQLAQDATLWRHACETDYYTVLGVPRAASASIER